MFQRELLYAAGGRAASGWPRHWGERGVLSARRGCVRSGGRETGTSRLQTHRSGRENPGEPAKKTCRTFQKFSCRFGQSAEDSPRAWVDIDIHHGLW